MAGNQRAADRQTRTARSSLTFNKHHPPTQPHSKMMRFFAECQAEAKLAGASNHVVIPDPFAGACVVWRGEAMDTRTDWLDGSSRRIQAPHDSRSLYVSPGLTKLVEGFLASTAPESHALGSAGNEEKGAAEQEEQEEDRGPQELLRMLTSDEVGYGLRYIYIILGGGVQAPFPHLSY
jgi:hypothetical protein